MAAHFGYRYAVANKLKSLRSTSAFRWLRTGGETLDAMRSAILAARRSVRLETYIFDDSTVGCSFRDALAKASSRGVRVQVLVDAAGSFALAESFWEPLRAAGGDVRSFNPLTLERISYRDHRKTLVADDSVAFVGGCNIAAEYSGDGVTHGWRDLGLQVSGKLAVELAESFDTMFERADFKHQRLQRLRRSHAESAEGPPDWQLLLSGPGRGHRVLKRTLARDLAEADSIQIISGYFLPTWRIRRELRRLARRGGLVQLILAGKSDVVLAQLASRHLYRGLLRAGVEIYEYQPQVLHSKLVIADDVVYAGSSNLDTRSLSINYELLVRVANADLAEEARAIFSSDLQHCRRIDPAGWPRSRNFVQKLLEYLACAILSRLDPSFARWQLRGLRLKQAAAYGTRRTR